MYESSATVLIESPQLPADNGNASALSDVIDQRIARARERVLSRQVLIQLIRTNALYPHEQETGKPFSEIVDKMRDDTDISGVASESGNMVQGHQTIALKIAFSYSDPIKAQAVAQQFVNRFLEVDASAQTEQAQGAANFLGGAEGELRNQITDLESQITKIKSENGSVLALGSISTGNPAQDAASIDNQIASIQTQNAQLQAQASAVGGDSAVAAAEQQLRVARARYSDTHPDVIAAQQALAAARAASTGAAAPNQALTIQLNANRQQISQLQAAKGMLLSQSASARAAAARAPALQAQIDQLEKQAEVKRDSLRMMGMRTQNATLNAKMETEQKGERLTLADPPVVPDTPYKPNRKIFVAGGFSGGVALGLLIVLGLELLLRPIRGVDAVRAATGIPPLAIIPDYERKPNIFIRFMERRNRKKSDRKAAKAFRKK
jgi:polysaccharide biosynthesis transport protein